MTSYEINQIPGEKRAYKLVQNQSLKTEALYDKFTNWVSGEFDLYLQDESSGLIVYYPSGWFCIRTTNENKDIVNMQITIVGKSEAFCKHTLKSLEAIYNHINHYFTFKTQNELCLTH